LACLVLGVLLQAGTNVLNDAEDAMTGADDVETAFPSMSMRRGWIDVGDARRIAATAFALAAVLGLTLALGLHKPGLLLLGAAGLAIGWAYTAPPLRLAYRPLGELASALPMGVGITWGTAAAQTDHVPTAVWWASAPLALLIAAILHANNARDRAHDATVGKQTLATRISPRLVVLEYQALLVGSVPIVLVGIATGGLPATCAIALIPGALAVRAATTVNVGTDGAGWTRAMLGVIRLLVLTGVCLAIGLVAGGL